MTADKKPLYTYADALQKLALLGFGPDAPKPEAPPDEEFNDWLFAPEIPEMQAWFEDSFRES